MSNIIKLGKNKNKLVVKISNSSGFGPSNNETQEAYSKRLEDEKYAQIFNAGKEEAIKDLKENLNKNLHQKFLEYNNLMNSLEEQLILYQNSFDKIVIESSFIIASKIIKKSVKESPIITKTIREAISKIVGANNIILRLNPKDLGLIQETEPDFLDNSSYSNLKFEVDDRIDSGGCFVESEIGNVDARISSQLNELKNLLKLEPNSEN